MVTKLGALNLMRRGIVTARGVTLELFNRHAKKLAGRLSALTGAAPQISNQADENTCAELLESIAVAESLPPGERRIDLPARATTVLPTIATMKSLQRDLTARGISFPERGTGDLAAYIGQLQSLKGGTSAAFSPSATPAQSQAELYARVKARAESSDDNADTRQAKILKAMGVGPFAAAATTMAPSATASAELAQLKAEVATLKAQAAAAPRTPARPDLIELASAAYGGDYVEHLAKTSGAIFKKTNAEQLAVLEDICGKCLVWDGISAHVPGFPAAQFASEKPRIITGLEAIRRDSKIEKLRNFLRAHPAA